MSWKIKPAKESEMGITSYAGIIRCEYDVLVNVLGTPSRDGLLDSKVTCSWDLSLRTEAGLWLIFTVYNWKDKAPPEKNEMWHIGSNHVDDNEIFAFLRRVLKDYTLIQRSGIGGI